MSKIWSGVFWGKPGTRPPQLGLRDDGGGSGPVLPCRHRGLAEPLLGYAERAATDLLDPARIASLSGGGQMIVATTRSGLPRHRRMSALVRVVRGPSVADRMVALDTLLFIGVGGIGVYIVRTGDITFIPVLVVAVLMAFVGTVVVARYIEAETGS